MLKHKFRGTIKDRKLVILDRVALDEYIASLPEGTEVGLIIAKRQKDRSDRQNGYYWGVVLKLIAKDTGHTEEELHEIFKRKFLPPKVVTYRGVGIKMPSSTTEASTLEFTDYIERIRAEAGTMGITIPDPDQVHF